MKKTQKKIVVIAIKLFNTKGVGNTRLQDISAACGISSGNLSYHYKTKKDLMQVVLDFMQERFSQMSVENLSYLDNAEYHALIKNYLKFKIDHRFFARDILEIMNLIPEADLVFESQMKQVVSFTKKGMGLAVNKGILKPEPHERHYDFFAKNVWAILQSWLSEREVLGTEKVSLEEILLAVWEFHYPYFTTAGIEQFKLWKSQIPQLIEEEV